MKFPTIENMSELRKLEAAIGFTSGILVGALAGAVAVLFFAQMAWYFKLFTAIGSLGIIGSLYMSLSEQIRARRSLISAMEEMGLPRIELRAHGSKPRMLPIKPSIDEIYPKEEI